MVLIVKKGSTKKTLRSVEQKMLKHKFVGFNPDKYLGAVAFEQDGLSLQLSVRNEWERASNRH